MSIYGLGCALENLNFVPVLETESVLLPELKYYKINYGGPTLAGA